LRRDPGCTKATAQANRLRPTRQGKTDITALLPASPSRSTSYGAWPRSPRALRAALPRVLGLAGVVRTPLGNAAVGERARPARGERAGYPGRPRSVWSTAAADAAPVPTSSRALSV
jgi:hypothetical protein